MMVMNNTEKKLDALIDALGFDVEEVVTTVHPPFSIMKALFTDRYNQQGPVDTVNYKITKRRAGGIKCTKCGTHLANDSPLDACMCKTSLNLVRFGS